MALTDAEKQRDYRKRRNKNLLPLTVYLPKDLSKEHRDNIRKIVKEYLIPTYYHNYNNQER